MKTLFAWLVFAAVLAASSVAGATTVLITGSNRGLGLEFAKEYAARGWTVIATARNPDASVELKALAAKYKNIVIEKLDVVDGPGVKALAAKYEGRPIDILINNAGVLGDLPGQTLGNFNYADFQQVMGVNVYGVLAVCEAFRENVARSEQKKIVAITSGSGIISRGGSSKMIFYRASKVALNMCLKGLAVELHDRGIVVGMIAPGGVDTDMLRQAVGSERAAKALRPSQSVAGMIKVIDGLTQANSDRPINYDGAVLPW